MFCLAKSVLQLNGISINENSPVVVEGTVILGGNLTIVTSFWNYDGSILLFLLLIFLNFLL